MSNAIFIKGDIKTINQKDISILKEKACNSDNGRYRYCLHEDISDSVQSMVIAITSSSKLLPQRRIGTNKFFTILEGEIAIIVFDDDGSVINNLLLSKKNTNTLFLSGEYYTLTHPISKIAVYQELITNSLNNRNDHPTWSINEKEVNTIISNKEI